MLAVLLLVLGIWCGFCLTRLITKEWYLLEFIGVSVAIGILVSSWILFVLSFLLGYQWGMLLTILGLLTSCSSLQLRSAHKISFLPLKKLEQVWLVFYFLVWGVMLCHLFSSHLFFPKLNGWYSGGSTWGDLGLHSTLSTYFAQQKKPSLVSPVYSSQNLTYPFLLDFYTAELMRGGLQLRTSLLVTSLLLSFSIVSLAYFLLRRLTQTVWPGLTVLFLFLLNSNWGIYYFFQDWWSSGKSLLLFLQNLPEGYVHLGPKNLDWPQFLIDYFLPQRGILVGFAAFLVVLLLLLHLFTELTKKKQRPEIVRNYLYWLAGVVGLLPLFHVHTFFVVLGIIGWFTLVGVLRKKLSGVTLLGPGMLLVGLSVLQLTWQFHQTFHAGFIHFQFGWAGHLIFKSSFNPVSLVWFWIRNLGLEFFLSLGGLLYIFRAKNKYVFIQLLAVPLCALFILCNFVIFQPNTWDNTKFMFYTHFLLVITTLIFLKEVLVPLKAGKYLVGVIGLVLTIGGAIALLHESEVSWLLASNSDIAIAQQIQQHTPPDAIFLSADSHNHPVPMLAGRPVVMGYRGWLWTYGIEYYATERDVFEIFHGEPNARSLLRSHHVSYVYIGSTELEEFGAKEQFFKENFQLVINTPQARVYAVTP